MPESPVLDIGLELAGVRLAAAFRTAILAAESGKRSDPGLALVVHDVVAVILELGAAVVIHHAGKSQPRAQIEQHRLEAAHIAVRLDHRPADGVRHRIGLADRPVEKRDRIMPFEIGRVGKHQVGIGDHFRRIGVGIDQLRYLVLAGLRIGLGQHIHDAARIHRGIPRHVRHIHEQHVDRIGIAGDGVRDDHMHHPVGRHRGIPAIGLVDPLR